MIPGVPMSTILPPDVRAKLVWASQIDSRLDPDGTCEARNAAVELAIADARAAHPHHFLKER